MKVVLYTDEMEPITVIDLSEVAMRYLLQQGVVRLPVPVLPSLTPMDDDDMHITLKTVSIFAERLIRKDNHYLLLFTHDEESAMLLKSAFLPGQYAALHEAERDAFAKGFLDALSRVGGL